MNIPVAPKSSKEVKHVLQSLQPPSLECGSHPLWSRRFTVAVLWGSLPRSALTFFSFNLLPGYNYSSTHGGSKGANQAKKCDKCKRELGLKLAWRASTRDLPGSSMIVPTNYGLILLLPWSRRSASYWLWRCNRKGLLACCSVSPEKFSTRRIWFSPLDPVWRCRCVTGSVVFSVTFDTRFVRMPELESRLQHAHLPIQFSWSLSKLMTRGPSIIALSCCPGAVL